MTVETAFHQGHRTAPATGVECIRDARGFRSLRTEWHQLSTRYPGVTPFNSWEWLFSWWQAYGAGRQLRILLIRIDGSLAGIMPLYLGSEITTLGIRCSVLRFIGDGSFDSDHLGFLFEPVKQTAVMQQFEQWLRHEREWDALVLREITASSVLGPALHDLAGSLAMPIRADTSACAVLDLPRSFGEFLEDRQSRFRTRIRSSLKSIDAGELVFEAQCTPRDLRKRLRSLFDLHQRRWGASGRSGVFGASAKRLFYAHFVPRFARNGWLRLYSLRRGNEYVAHQLCFGTGGTTYLLQEGFDVSDPTASYGQVLRAAVIRHLIASGETRYDFLGGISRHKVDWGAKRGSMTHLIIARKAFRGWLYLNAPALREQIAVMAKRLLPESVWQRLRRAREA